MSKGQFNTFTIGGESVGLKVSDIQYAFQRVVAGKHNDTILHVKENSGARLKRIEIDEAYADFLDLGLNQFMDVTYIDGGDIERPIALNAFNVDNFHGLAVGHTLVNMNNGRRFKVNMPLSTFTANYNGALDAAILDFSAAPQYDTKTEAQEDETLTVGKPYLLTGDQPDAGDTKIIYVKR